MQSLSSKPVLGIVERVSIGKRAVDVPAKIDTGADSSAIWASNIRINKDGVLIFSLFGEGSPYYTGKVFKRTDYTVAQVKSSNGASEVRYRTKFSITIGGRRIRATFNLSDRSKNTYKILIGRRTVSGKFYVDVSKGASELPKGDRTKQLASELKKNPRAFHKKHTNNKKGVAA